MVLRKVLWAIKVDETFLEPQGGGNNMKYKHETAWVVQMKCRIPAKEWGSLAELIRQKNSMKAGVAFKQSEWGYRRWRVAGMTED